MIVVQESILVPALSRQNVEHSCIIKEYSFNSKILDILLNYY